MKRKQNVLKKLCFTLGVSLLLAGASLSNKALAAGNQDEQVENVWSDPEDTDILNASASDVIASGTTKGKCSWSIDSNYGLTIKGGKGAILYGTDNSCWSQYKEQIASITIDVPAAKDLESMFEGCYSVQTIKAKIDMVEGSLKRTFMCRASGKQSSLITADLSGMNVSKVTNMESLFGFCSNLTSAKMGNWDTSSVTNMSFAFNGCFKLESLDVANWGTSNVTTMQAMFQGCNSLKNLDVSKWNTKKLEKANFLFSGCHSLKTIDVSKWNTSNVIMMDYMFQSCRSVTTLNVSNFNTSKVKTMEGMFYRCESLKKINLGNFDTRNVTDMVRMFGECKGLTSLNLKNFNTSQVTAMSEMFYACTNLTDLNLSSFDTSKVTDVKNMFLDCKKLKKLDLHNFWLGKVVMPEKLTGLIDGCESLESFQTPKMMLSDVSFNTNPQKGRVWYRDDNHTQTNKLPKNMKKSISIHLQEKGNKIVDVRTTGWEYNSVKFVIDKSLMNGVGTTNDKNKLVIFKGNDTLTRGMFVRVLFNKENPKLTSTMTNPFKDVKKTDYFYDAVRWANNKKIVNGTSKTTFGPNESIKRQDLVVILYNYAKTKGNKYVSVTANYNINGFKDYKKISNYAVIPMKWAACHKIISGQPIKGSNNYNLNPVGTATRAECAQILMNFENYIKSVK